jgi:2-dehydropantoate 2-reductase
MLDSETIVVSTGNGFPWCYYYQSNLRDHPEFLRHVDAAERLGKCIGPERAIGSVVYPAARVSEPGVIEHVFGDRFTLGEPDGSISDRVRMIAAMLTEAGLDASAIDDIRSEIWTKLVANCAYNPVSVISNATLGGMLDDPDVHRILEQIMNEASALAAALNVSLPLMPKQLLELTRPFGAHKTSMLQDIEAGRPIELDPIVGAIRELAQFCTIATPTIDFVSALAAQRARLAGCYPG